MNRHTVRNQFGLTAEAYATSTAHAQGESLAALMELTQPQSDWLALDIATGAGHTALTLAPHVRHVVALDLTSQMLTTARRLAAERGLPNLSALAADGEALPFRGGAFDLVTCRLAMHHFPRPAHALAECARVLKRDGVYGFTDNIAVPDEEAARVYNAYERLRDPSHQWVYPLDDLLAMFGAAGLRVEATRQLSKEFEFHEWADRQRVSPADKERLLAMMRAIPPALQPLFAPRWEHGTMCFNLWEVVVIARKV
jgi:ubiquinone/menaquinone biosynthesis C-methylase UbiE